MSKLAPTTGAYLYLHADGLGSVRVATSATGTTQDTCDYDAFGAGYAGDPPCLAAAAFAGQARDGETGLYHLRARQYDPGTGRFTQADPLGYGGGGNLYAYAGNNPGTTTDPSGLCPICIGVVGGGLAGLGAYALSHRGDFDGGEAARWTALGALAGGTLGIGVEVAAAYGLIGGGAAATTGVGVGAAGAGATAPFLTQLGRQAYAAVGPGRGAVHGTRVHTAFRQLVDASGRPNLFTEVTYRNRQLVRYGTRGGVRLDVIEGSRQTPTAVYDLKTNGAALTAARIAQIRQHLPNPNVPVIGINVP